MSRERAGRKRKPGERFACGQPKVTRDYGCDGVRRRKDLYGKPPSPANDANGKVGGPDVSQTFDALGRAWSAGLLGVDEDRARELLDGGRRIAAQYWRVYGYGCGDSLARFQPSQSFGIENEARDKIREDALNDTLAAVSALGRDVRKAFDELIIDPNPDCGPSWLDKIILGGARIDHLATLRLATRGLREVA